MGSLLISVVLIIAILIIAHDEIKLKTKVITGVVTYVLVVLIEFAFKINIILYFLAAFTVGCWLAYDKNYLYYTSSKRNFLIIVCFLTFFSINAWGIAGSFVLCSCFDYGIIKSIYKGFTEMNSTFDFTLELANEMLIKSEFSVFSVELKELKEQLSPRFHTIDTLRTLLNLIDYL